MNEYRCTRSSLYEPGSIGFENIEARQGHYIEAETPLEAYHAMERKFPYDDCGFSVELFKVDGRRV